MCTLLSKRLADEYGSDCQILTLHQADFYRELGSQERRLAERGEWNAEHPGTVISDIATIYVILTSDRCIRYGIIGTGTTRFVAWSTNHVTKV
jgi:hypothetical protein